MPGEEILLLGAGGAVIAVAATAAPAPARTPTLVNGGVPIAPQVPGHSVTAPRRANLVIGRYPRPVSATTYDPTMAPTQQQAVGSAQNAGPTDLSGDPLIQGKLNLIRIAAEAAYGKLSDGAKQKAADQLNAGIGTPTPTKPNPPISSSDTFDDVVTKVSAALGASAGAAVGSIFGPVGGVIGGAIGGVIGAYLGEHLGPLLEKSWDDLKAYLSSVWGDLSSGDIGKAVDDTGNAIQQQANDAYNFVGGLF